MLSGLLFDFIRDEHIQKELEGSPPLSAPQLQQYDSADFIATSPYLQESSCHEYRHTTGWRSPFVSNSPEALHLEYDEESRDSSNTRLESEVDSQLKDGTETTLYVRRSMLEKPRRRSAPSRCSLSIRDPGSDTRRVIQVEEIPIVCKRLRIRHGMTDYEKILELPPFQLMARRKRQSGVQSTLLNADAYIPTSLQHVPMETISKLIQTDNTHSNMVDTIQDAESSTTYNISEGSDNDSLKSAHVVQDCMIDPILLHGSPSPEDCVVLKSEEPIRKRGRPRKDSIKTNSNSAVMRQSVIKYKICKPVKPIVSTTIKTEPKEEDCEGNQTWWKYPTWKLVPKIKRQAPLCTSKQTLHNMTIISE